MEVDYKYGVVFYLNDEPDKIIHLVLYPEPPTPMCYFSLGWELATDEEFGLMNFEGIQEQLRMRDATPKEVAHFAKKMKKAYGE